MSSMDTGISITKEQYEALKAAADSGDYTLYHYLKAQYGSDISMLYVPGPTGQGFFGTLSHEYTKLHIGSEEFLKQQANISRRIVENDLK